MILFYYGCEFIYTAAIVWAIFATLDVASNRSVASYKTERAKYITVAFLSALEVLNVYTGSGVFSNSITWISITVLAIVSKMVWKRQFRRSWMIGNLFWSLVVIADFFIQATVTSLLYSGQINHALMIISWVRGVYLLIWAGVMVVYIRCWLSQAGNVIKWLCSDRIIRMTTLIVIFCVYYFSRIYAVDMNSIYFENWWGMVLGFVLFVVGVIIYSVNEKGKNTTKLLQIKCGLLEEQYQQIRAERESKDILLHDMKNHLLAIAGLAQDGQVKQIETYVQEMYHILELKGQKISVGHPFLDLILDQKIAQAECAGIKVKTEVGDLSDLTLSEMEICALFSNLLDNAIEANERLGDRAKKWIRIICKRQNRLLIVWITNPTEIEVVNGEIPETTKTDKVRHGLGLRSVKQIVEGHEGILRICTENGAFEVYICMSAFM
ncbi:MAG: GHKL domain-containing protein [Lachnospiraceae bacterium]|nr:GHKL domain-containing protein [Lachnospiraceae bacterium]